MLAKLYAHVFSSFSQKAFIAFYEKEEPFELRHLAPDNPSAGEEWLKLWPIGKFPVLAHEGETVVEASSIIEWLEIRRPDGPKMIPDDPRAALQARMRDRIFDSYVMEPMQRIVFDRLRPEGERDPHGVAKAHEMLAKTYDWLDGEMVSREWAAGAEFGIADCAAAPSLFYADWVQPFDGRRNLIAYYERLRARPSFARCVEDARECRSFFPGGAPKDRVG